MAGGGNNTGFDPQARYAALDERVTNLGTRLTSFEQNTARSFTQLEASIVGLSAEFRTNQRPQWAALGVMLTAVIAIGALAYWPVRENQNEFRESIKTITASINVIPKEYLSRQEADQRAARGLEDRQRTESAITDLRGNAVPRGEWTERQAAINATTADLGRRLDELRQDFGATYGIRDALNDLRSRLERIEEAGDGDPRRARLPR